MPADNPISWLILTIIGLYYIYRFLRKLYFEVEERRKERERYNDNEIFLESNLDKRNIAVYNRYNKNFGQKKF